MLFLFFVGQTLWSVVWSVSIYQFVCLFVCLSFHSVHLAFVLVYALRYFIQDEYMTRLRYYEPLDKRTNGRTDRQIDGNFTYNQYGYCSFKLLPTTFSLGFRLPSYSFILQLFIFGFFFLSKRIHVDATNVSTDYADFR